MPQPGLRESLPYDSTAAEAESRLIPPAGPLTQSQVAGTRGPRAHAPPRGTLLGLWDHSKYSKY